MKLLYFILWKNWDGPVKIYFSFFILHETWTPKVTLFQTFYSGGLFLLIVWLLVSLVRLLNLPFDQLQSSQVVMQEL